LPFIGILSVSCENKRFIKHTELDTSLTMSLAFRVLLIRERQNILYCMEVALLHFFFKENIFSEEAMNLNLGKD